MSDRSTTFVLDRKTGKYCQAFLIDGVSAQEIEKADASWNREFEKLNQRLDDAGIPRAARPEHAHWNWRKKWEFTNGILAYRFLGIECEAELQGLMLLATGGKDTFSRIPAQKNKPLVYVHFVATAPWNSHLVVEEPRYAQVGRVLVAAAIQISQSEEFEGRLGLHSLPQSESWYRECCSMTDLGPDTSKKSLRYFEMTPEQARTFLQ